MSINVSGGGEWGLFRCQDDAFLSREMYQCEVALGISLLLKHKARKRKRERSILFKKKRKKDSLRKFTQINFQNIAHCSILWRLWWSVFTWLVWNCITAPVSPLNHVVLKVTRGQAVSTWFRLSSFITVFLFFKQKKVWSTSTILL